MKPVIISKNKLRSILWDHYKQDLFGGEPSIKDASVYTNFIILLSQVEEAQEKIDIDGLFYDSTDKFGKLLVKVNPAHRLIADNLRMLIPYYNRYGLSEWDRLSNIKRFDITEDSDGDFSDLQ
ncbi:hypothetical protein [Acetobacter persici]|uniref:hypothetical protein n=1 Tax=Acetobacter persici TaxID=1076596 RepID=UPI001BA9451F|nr:hypothetical protein [Acetobacter persici]MBS1016874.1 hypothetical protein [Acetobacter persici]